MNPAHQRCLSATVLIMILGSAAVASTPVTDVATEVAPTVAAAAVHAKPSVLPTPLDYVVLASLADASSLLSLTSLRAPMAPSPSAHARSYKVGEPQASR